MIEPGDLILARPLNWLDLTQKRVHIGLILEVRNNALWGYGSARVLCEDEIVRDFGVWEMSPYESGKEDGKI